MCIRVCESTAVPQHSSCFPVSDELKCSGFLIIFSTELSYLLDILLYLLDILLYLLHRTVSDLKYVCCEKVCQH